ncbi:TIGR04222 domain-containing membrane protein [Actinomycetospora sp. C-140]
MGPTWGISGPLFLLVYVVLLVAAAIVGPMLRRSLDRRSARDHGEAAAPDASVEDLALLAGGRRRLVEAAIARLVEGGVLRVSTDRRLGFTGRPPIGELDETVVGAVEARPSTTAGIVARTTPSAAVRDLETGAQRRGLLHDPAAVRRTKTIGTIAAVAVFVLGVARVAAGIARDAAVGVLVVLVVVAAVVSFTTLFVSTRRVTPRGTATLSQAWSREMQSRTGGAPAHGRAPGAVLAGSLGVAGLVAVFGLSSYPDPQLAGLLAAPVGGGGGGWDGGSDGGSSCGSSCGGGGGGCGGGGGGGCGG